MATSVMIGQKALFGLPPLPRNDAQDDDASVEESIFNYALPVQLKIFEKDAKKRGNASNAIGNGLNVYKVSKKGERQLRRIAISSDNRFLLISTEREKFGLRRRVKNSSTTVIGKDTFKKVEINAIENVVRGQITEKFLNRPKEASPTMKMPVSEDKLSLSIVFRISLDADDITQEEDLSVSKDSSNLMATLDLIIPSHNDYEILVSTIRNLMHLNKKYSSTMHRDVLLLQYYWREINKPLNGRINETEWSAICCDRLAAPIGKPAALALYGRFCHAMKVRQEGGVALQTAVALLEHTRKLSLQAASMEDPCDKVWRLVNTSSRPSISESFPDNSAMNLLEFGDGDSSMVIVQNSKTRSGAANDDGEYISAEAFLSFLRSEQKDTRMSLDDVNDLFMRLNAQTYASQLKDDGIRRGSDSVSYSKHYITKSIFMSYLRSDVNDAFDPVRGELEHDDMTHPLSCYWINSSHDTYLKGVAPRMDQRSYGGTSPVDVGMFTAALNRGSRCLEVDVWDGVGNQYGQPVVRFDDSSALNKGDKVGLLFSDVVKAIHSFLTCQRGSLPIILFLEVHCSVENQSKMAKALQFVLGEDDMIYIPSENDEQIGLPSPNDLRGKVVLKFKIPREGTNKVMCDDFDDVNDKNPLNSSEQPFVDETDLQDVIPGVEAVGSILFESTRDLVSDDKLKSVSAEAESARISANQADDNAFSARVKANRAEELSHQLLERAGLTPEEAAERLGLVKPKLHVHISPEPAQVIDYTADESESFSDEESTIMHDDVFESVTKKAGFGRGGFMRQLLGWADTLDGDEEEREVGGSFHSDHTSDSDTRDGNSSGDDSFDADEDVDNSSFLEEAPGNTIIDYIEKVADMADDYHKSSYKKEKEKARIQEKELEKAQENDATVHRSISNVQRKLEKVEQDEPGAIEIQNIYSSALDYIVVAQQEAQQREKKAGKILSSATAKFNKCQQEHEEAKNKLDNIDKVMNLKVELEERMEKKRQAESAAGTAQSEFKISEERANETAEGSKRAHAKADSANIQLQDQMEQEEDSKRKLSECMTRLKNAKAKLKIPGDKLALIQTELDKVTGIIKRIERSHVYKVETKHASKGVEEEGPEIKKHRMQVERQIGLNQRLKKTQKTLNDLKEEVAEAQKKVDDADVMYHEEIHRTAKARDYAERCEAIVEQYDNYAEEEKDAADMRLDANVKAGARLATHEAEVKALQAQLEKMMALPDEFKYNREEAENLRRDTEQKKVKLSEAESEFREAQDAYKWAGLELKETTNMLNENSHLLYKAKLDAEHLDRRANADKILIENALAAYKRTVDLQKEAEEAKVDASKERIIAAEKATAARRAQDYKDRLTMIHEVCPRLSKLLLLHSSKFRYFEKSLVLPFTTVHSISEGGIIQLLSKDHDGNTSNFLTFNKTHLTRIFPSRHAALRNKSNNLNPLLPWSLGCQVASINQQMCDAFVLVNDGRFRANGSCGYVLKPESMLDKNDIISSTTSSKHINTPFLPKSWRFQVLSGYNLPKHRKKASSGSINPRVRVTLYDGGTAAPIVHLTKTIQKNGLNPVWNETDTEGAIFDGVKDPDCAIVLFSLWDDDKNNKEYFLAAAAIPLSCMRQGYRSVPLFDSNHRRCGAHAFTSLFIKVSAS